LRSGENEEVNVDWKAIFCTIFVWTLPLVIIFGGMMTFIIWATQWVDTPQWTIENFSYFSANERGLM
jgi:hypothetical protein